MPIDSSSTRPSPLPATPNGLRALTAEFPRPGRLDAIWVRSEQRGAMLSLNEAQAEVGRGLLGDHRSLSLRLDPDRSARDITLIQAEHIAVIAQWTGQTRLKAGVLRRNLVISGVNLLSLRSPFADTRQTWQLGDQVLLQFTGPCDPCSRMEALLGPGGYNAMRGHGGLTARLLRGGRIQVGDLLKPAGLATNREGAQDA